MRDKPHTPHKQLKAQAGLEAIISLGLVVILLLGITRTFAWFNQCLAERQRAYDGTREAAGGNYVSGTDIFGGGDYVEIDLTGIAGDLGGTARFYVPLQSLCFLDPYNRPIRYKEPDSEGIAVLLDGVDIDDMEDFMSYFAYLDVFSHQTRPPNLMTLQRKGLLGERKTIW